MIAHIEQIDIMYDTLYMTNWTWAKWSARTSFMNRNMPENTFGKLYGTTLRGEEPRLVGIDHHMWQNVALPVQTGNKDTITGLENFHITKTKKVKSLNWRECCFFYIFFFYINDVIIMVEYVPLGKTVNQQYYLEVLAKLKEKKDKEAQIHNSIMFYEVVCLNLSPNIQILHHENAIMFLSM